MSPALAYIILGTANFFGSLPVHNTSRSVPGSIPTTTKEVLELQATRYNYTITPSAGTKFYKVHSELENWNEARRMCQEEGGHLAIMNSAAEAQTVGQLLMESNLEWAHIGFHDIFQEGEYVTVHGESLAKAGYEGWHKGEPNNWDDNEDCGVLWVDGTLNDGRCEHRHNFICELPQVEPCTMKFQPSHEPVTASELLNRVSA